MARQTSQVGEQFYAYTRAGRMGPVRMSAGALHPPSAPYQSHYPPRSIRVRLGRDGKAKHVDDVAQEGDDVAPAVAESRGFNVE